MTLVGPGGVGKTRLLVEVGHRLRAARPDRPVVLCELADAPTRGRRSTCVAAALGIDARPGVPLVERIVDVLRRRPRSCCWWTTASTCSIRSPSSWTQLLARCPNVRVVATSRERLRVPGEHVRIVPTLPCRRRGRARGAAVRRAGHGRSCPASTPTASELACVAEIVRRLDGLPLAIELAAARLHTHDVDEVAAGLDHRFALLSSGYRTSTRHASLGAAVSWSFGLLDDQLQETFADLSVFAGSFDAADAAAVCGADAAVTTDVAGPARRAFAGDAGAEAGGTCCSRRCGRSAPSSWSRTVATSRSPSGTPAIRSTGSSTPTGGCPSPAGR